MATPNGSVRPAISFPALEEMMYPRLEGLVRVVADAAALLKLRAEELSAVRVLMTSATNGCNSAMLAAMPSLGLIVSQGIGADRFDTAALAARGIRLRLVGEATDDVADLAMTLLNMIGRGLVRGDVFARSGAWQRGRFEVGESLVGKTIGIGGLSGRIGQAIARRAVVSRMTVAGLRRKSNEGLVATLHDDWAALAAASDILVLAMPASPETRHVIGAAELKALGPKGYLVNVGRGELVDTQAMIEALEQKQIAGAALDVLEGEPVIPPRLAALANVVVSPHVGGGTRGARNRAAKVAEDEILAFLG